MPPSSASCRRRCRTASISPTPSSCGEARITYALVGGVDRSPPSHDRSSSRCASRTTARAAAADRQDLGRRCRQLDGAALQAALQAIYTPLLTPANLKQVRTNEFLVGPQDPAQQPAAWELREFHLGTDARLHQVLLPLQVDPAAVQSSRRLPDLGADERDGAAHAAPSPSRRSTRCRPAARTARIVSLSRPDDRRTWSTARPAPAATRRRPTAPSRTSPSASRHRPRRDLAVPRGRARKARQPPRPRRLRARSARRSTSARSTSTVAAHARCGRRAALHARIRRRSRRGRHAARRARRLARLPAPRARRRRRARPAAPLLLRPARQRTVAARRRRRAGAGSSTSPTSTPCACISAARR